MQAAPRASRVERRKEPVMSAQDNAAVVRSLYESFNAKDFDRIASLCEPKGVATVMPFGARKGISEVFQMWAEGFPDGKIEIRSLVANEGSVVCEFIGRGTQTGALRGLAGVIPATGRRAEIPFCDCLDVRDGKV